MPGITPVCAILFDQDQRQEPGSAAAGRIAPDVRALKRSIESLPDQTALLDPDWRVLAVSPAWAREGETGEVRAVVPGDDFRELAKLWVIERKRNAELLLAAVENLSAGRVASFHHVFEVSERI
jgi:hypothetical protein